MRSDRSPAQSTVPDGIVLQAPPLPPHARLAVIMPCLNEAAHIGETLEALLEQKLDSGSFRLIVVDGGSTDGTMAIVQELAQRDERVELLHNPKRLAGPARNIGIRHTDADIIAIVDAHVRVPTDRLLDSIVEVLRETRAYCLSRPQPLYADPSSDWQRSYKLTRASWLGHCPGSLIYDQGSRGFVSPISGAQVYRREVFDIVGWFAENIDACEDLELNMRVDKARLATFHCPSLTVEYYPRRDLKALYRHMVRYGHGRVLVAGHHLSSARSLVAMTPALFVSYVALGPVLWLVSGSLGPLHAASLALYLAVVGMESLRIGARDGWRMSPLVFSQFLAIHAGWGVGQLKSLFRHWRIPRTRELGRDQAE